MTKTKPLRFFRVPWTVPRRPTPLAKYIFHDASGRFWGSSQLLLRELFRASSKSLGSYLLYFSSCDYMHSFVLDVHLHFIDTNKHSLFLCDILCLRHLISSRLFFFAYSCIDILIHDLFFSGSFVLCDVILGWR